MSGRYRITPRAAADLRAIARYTVQTWGYKQRDIYLSAIDRRFSWLAENPSLGGLVRRSVTVITATRKAPTSFSIS